MTVKDILVTSAVFLGRDDLITYLTGTGITNTALDKEIAVMVRCVNLVINELATEYVPVKAVDDVVTENGQVLFSTLSHSPLDILNVYDFYGNKLSYALRSLYIKTKPEAVRVEYTYIPSAYVLSDTVAYTEKEIPLRVIAYGVTAELCLIDGRFDEANIWEKRFKDSITNVILPKRLVTKGRCWR